MNQRKARKMASPEHEAKCRRCGECCRNEVIVDGVGRIVLDSFCPCLDPVTKLCMIYDQRHEKSMEILRGGPCLTINRAIVLKEVPPTCAYVNSSYCGYSYEPDRLRLISDEDKLRIAKETEHRRHLIRQCANAQKEGNDDSSST